MQIGADPGFETGGRYGDGHSFGLLMSFIRQIAVRIKADFSVVPDYRALFSVGSALMNRLICGSYQRARRYSNWLS